ncbi:MAG TPA: carbon-nitrogen family hydrolase [Chloroflexia bacterium]|nr:carbon-nitrogen family hydrolase [Chloroflexia bacterium]
MGTLDVAVVQMEVCSGEVRKNCVRAEARIVEAARHGAQAILLPELWTTGYNWPAMPGLAEGRDGETVRWLSQLAARCRVSLVAGSLAEARDGQIYNTSYIITPDGTLAGAYSKQHLFPLLDEPRYMAPGADPAVVPTGQGRWGQLICFDIRFPEAARSLAVAGAEILWVPAEWPHPRLEHWRTLLRARAIEDQLFVVAANRCGQGDGNTWCGHSQIIDPWGIILAEAEEAETTLYATLHLDLIADVRARIPCFTVHAADPARPGARAPVGAPA